MIQLLLGYPYWFALMVEDGGAPPPFTFPPRAVDRIAVTFTWGW